MKSLPATAPIKEAAPTAGQTLGEIAAESGDLLRETADRKSEPSKIRSKAGAPFEPSAARAGSAPVSANRARSFISFKRSDFSSSSPDRKKKGPKKSGNRPASIPPAPKKEPRKLTEYDIFRARFGQDEEIKLLRKAHGLEKHLNGVIFGQPQASALLQTKVQNYLQTFRTRKKAPVYLVLGGLTGIGKSDLVAEAAKYMGMKMAAISLQDYVGDDEEVPEAFAGSISRAVDSFEGKPGILLLDELDKVYEKDELGREVDRPVIGILNKNLTDGKLSHGGKWRDYQDDLSNVLVVVAMNFRPDIYGDLTAHPDLTSIRDLQEIHEEVGIKPVDIAEALGSMFRVNTVSRLLPQTHVMRPLDEEAYRKLIDFQIGEAVKRLLPENNDKSMSMEATGSFKELLFRETVIPATGARETVQGVGDLVESAFSEVLHRLPKPLAYRSLKITVDYDRNSGQVVVTASDSGKGKRAKPLVVRYQPRLRFEVVPIGPDEKIPEDRRHTAAHEFGHALAHVRYGVPFELMRVEPISSEIGGFVKGGHDEGDPTGRQMYAELLIKLASRAMERVIYSPDPLDPKTSLPHLTSGASSDLLEATKLAVRQIAQFGLDPAFGAMARWNKLMREEEMTQPVPEAVYERAREILNKMEQFLVEDFMSAHSRKWYAEKILKVARAGRLTEKEFYRVLGYGHPNLAHYLHDPDRGKLLESSRSRKKNLKARPQSRTRTTPKENLDKALKYVLGPDKRQGENR